MKIRYKLTDENLKTHNGTDWTSTDWKQTSGVGELCTSGWLHCYASPLLAVLLNPIHANFKNPRLLEVEVAGHTKKDYYLKEGWSRMRRIREIKCPVLTVEQRIKFAVLCALEVNAADKWFVEWATRWLDGIDRTRKTAARAAEAAVATEAKAVRAATEAETARAATEAEAAAAAAWAVRAAADAAAAATEAARATRVAAEAAAAATEAARAAARCGNKRKLNLRKLARMA